MHDHSKHGKVSIILCAATGGTISDQLEMLLKHSSKGINQKCGQYGDVAIQAASHFGKLDHVKLLLKYGADPNA